MKVIIHKTSFISGGRSQNTGNVPQQQSQTVLGKLVYLCNFESRFHTQTSEEVVANTSYPNCRLDCCLKALSDFTFKYT